MHNGDFEGPPAHWLVLSIVGAIATAITLIITLEFAANEFRVPPEPSTKVSTESS